MRGQVRGGSEEVGVNVYGKLLLLLHVVEEPREWVNLVPASGAEGFFCVRLLLSKRFYDRSDMDRSPCFLGWIYPDSEEGGMRSIWGRAI